MGLANKALRRCAARILRSRGYSSYFAPYVFDEVMQDLFRYPIYRLPQKMWAYRRGFLSKCIGFYGLTDQNYRDYLPNFPYWRLHPLNGRYSRWIDDKLTVRYMLAPFAEHLPKYYFHLANGRVYRLLDCPAQYASDIPGVLALLQSAGTLAMKPVRGTGGIGFSKVSVSENGLFVNDVSTPRAEFSALLESARDHILMEYIVGHRDLRKVYAGSPNALRVLVIHDPGHPAEIIGGYIRFGWSGTGAVEDVYAGGVFCGVRVQDGTFFSPRRYEKGMAGRVIPSPEHPDTGVRIEGAVPFWDAIKTTLQEICSYLPQLCHMAFDIVITDTSYKILEINSHQVIRQIQQFVPLLANEYSKRFFERLLQERALNGKKR